MSELRPDELDALDRQGQVVQLRPLRPDDRDALHAIVTRCSDRSVFLRFFALSRHAAHRHVDELVAEAATTATEVAVVDGVVVAVASYSPVTAERGDVAVLVDDEHQHHGLGALLLEALAARARAAGLRELVADVLSENVAMLTLLRDLGYRLDVSGRGPEEQLVWHLDPGDTAFTRLLERDRIATARSLEPLLRPTSIAVIGASDRPRSVGRSVFAQLTASFAGPVFAVNPNRATVLDRPCYPDPAALPLVPDLAVLAVPPRAAVAAAQACAARGVRGLVVLGSGFREAGPDGERLEAELLTAAREHGMRIIGPNCLGVINADPQVRLHAALAAVRNRPGPVGLAAQSGALGIAAVADFERHATGISQFVSLGNKVDVSGNDLLQWWHTDPSTTTIGLYLESFGNPTRFRRVARAVTRDKPVIALKAGRTTAGIRAGSSHTAAAASADDLVDALCAQSGVARVDTLEELVAAVRLLANQPRPRGPRVAVVGNSGGPEILAADCAESRGLAVPVLPEHTSDRLREAIPRLAAATNPIDLGAEMSADDLEAALGIALDSDLVDAVAVVVCETAAVGAAELSALLARLPATGKPVAVTVLGADPVAETAGGPPVYDYPETAIGALATAWHCAELRAATEQIPPQPSAPPERRALLRETPDGWLDPADAARLLGAYDIPLVRQRSVHSVAEAVAAANGFGYPVVAKAEGIVHKTDVGGVRLDLRTPDDVAAATAELLHLGTSVTVQPVAASSVELLVGGVRSDPFGPAVVLAAGGVTTDLVADRAVRLAPLTTADTSAMLDALRCRAVFDGFRGAAPVSRTAVASLLDAVSRLFCEQPRVVELDLNPVRCAGDQLVVVDAKVRVAAASEAPDPLVRALRARPRLDAVPDSAAG